MNILKTIIKHIVYKSYIKDIEDEYLEELHELRFKLRYYENFWKSYTPTNNDIHKFEERLAENRKYNQSLYSTFKEALEHALYNICEDIKDSYTALNK